METCRLNTGDLESCMRILCALVALFLCTRLSGETTQQGRMVSGAGYMGVILTPAMMKASSTWKKLDPDRKKDFTFWTPTRDQIARAEEALSLRLYEDRADSQPGGFHFRNYYSPKYYSRDHLKRSDEDPIYYGWIEGLQSPRVHQYIGVTEWKDKKLLMVFLNNPPDATFKNSWIDQGPQIFYLLASDRFAAAEFAELEVR